MESVPVGLEAEILLSLPGVLLPVVEVQAVLVRCPLRQALVHIRSGDLIAVG